MSVVSARRLTRRFGSTVAVDGLDITVERGEIVGLLGANGAGKTTAMRMILGLIRPSSGEVLIEGQPVHRVPREHIGYVPQGLGLYRDLTVGENLSFVAAAFGVPPVDLDGEGIGEVGGMLVARVPLGVRRRVAFAAARSHRPSLLVLDEPTSGVGPLGRARLWQAIHEAASEGAAVLVSTHHMDEAEECDRVVMLASGRVVAAGPVSDLTAGLRAVSIRHNLDAAHLDALRAAGAMVLTHLGGWRVVGLDLASVREVLGPGVAASEVPATFEEAFVARSG